MSYGVIWHLHFGDIIVDVDPRSSWEEYTEALGKAAQSDEQVFNNMSNELLSEALQEMKERVRFTENSYNDYGPIWSLSLANSSSGYYYENCILVLKVWSLAPLLDWMQCVVPRNPQNTSWVMTAHCLGDDDQRWTESMTLWTSGQMTWVSTRSLEEKVEDSRIDINREKIGAYRSETSSFDWVCSGRSAVDLSGDVLTKEVAEKYKENEMKYQENESPDFSDYIFIEDAAAESLSKHEGGELELGGLTSLSDAAAESLSKHKGDLYLYGLTSLSDAAAESLSKYEGGLYLYGLTSLSDAAAESLSKYEGGLILWGSEVEAKITTLRKQEG